MPVQFTVLASGSGGNASLLAAHGFGLLLDAGLGPRKLGLRLHAAGASWNRVHAVLLTHTHADHCRATIFRHLLRRSIPLYCHAQHHDELCQFGPIFGMLREQGLVCGYESGKSLHLAPGFVCRPLPLRHDSTATFGFRFEIADGLFGDQLALAYAADLGTWDLDLAEALADVDLLALEFNHDVDLEQDSGRLPSLIERVLGDDGHLSNQHAAALLEEILRRSSCGRLRHLVQLHLSRDCNRPLLAAQAARALLAGLAPHVAVHTARQHEPSPTFALGCTHNGLTPSARRAVQRMRSGLSSIHVQPLLPGMEEFIAEARHREPL
ncbi:MAG: MBL fold metallo-hydrolase [Planctomycetota bacterium]|nr:MAG: MBL fold metallo-hydrolase [Planctomycetota bacterium]